MGPAEAQEGKMNEFEVGNRVEAGEGEDHDTGEILAIGTDRHDVPAWIRHEGNKAALVAWDGGAVRTWTTTDNLRRCDD